MAAGWQFVSTLQQLARKMQRSCTEHSAGWQLVSTLQQLARKRQRSCASGHFHVQRTPDQQMTIWRRGVRGHLRSSTLVGTVQSETLTRESWPSRKQHLATSSRARTRDATNLGSCTKLRMPCLRSCPTSRVARQSSPIEVQLPLRNLAMDVKELPGWIPEKWVKTLHVVCEGSSMHAVIPFGDNDTETSWILQRLLTDDWLRPYTRPRWLKVDEGTTGQSLTPCPAV